MKRQAYERAVEIHYKLDQLEDIKSTLLNSRGKDCKLTATQFTDLPIVKNATILDPELLDKFIRIINDEQKKLRDEFDNL